MPIKLETIVEEPAFLLEQLGDINKQTQDEFHAEGFPDYMIYSFLETAKITNTIILSRVPGGVGADLILEGFDLKGFHVKAKSCNWGPMAGFICQLPVFNKSGFSKLDFNTKEIGHYLKSLASFSDNKVKVEELEKRMKEDIAQLNSNAETYKKDKDAIIRKYSLLIRFIVLDHIRSKEEQTGHWTGENTLQEDLPFIPLRRKFAGDISEILKTFKGIAIESVKNLSDTLVYCQAFNVKNEANPDKNEATIQAEFILKKIDGDLWELYHGRIFCFYKKNKVDAANTKTVYAESEIKKLVDDELVSEFSSVIDTILARSKETLTIEQAGVPVNDVFTADTFSKTFYKVNGLMNPFPPFKKGSDLYYKNAVSGDYDLFAIWPGQEVLKSDLIRQSEITVGKQKRMSGKIFTIFPDINLGIELIPGFKELNPADANDVSKESADYGNMNPIGHLVSGTLNSIAAVAINNTLIHEKKMAKDKAVEIATNGISSSNKAFHSDEGGRPGIMEIEFPVAVFFPEMNNEFKSIALDNNTRGGFSTRQGTQARAGLVRSLNEMLRLILECRENNYTVLLHNGWMAHLFYQALKDTPGFDFETAVVNKYRDELAKKIKNLDDKQKKKLEKKFADQCDAFATIDKNRIVAEAGFINDGYNWVEEYLKDLKKLLWVDEGEDAFFYEFGKRLIEFYFEPDTPSLEKHNDLFNIIIDPNHAKANV